MIYNGIFLNCWICLNFCVDVAGHISDYKHTRDFTR